MNSTDNLQQLDGRVPIGKAFVFGLQHVLSMFVGNVTPIIIILGVICADKGLTANLIQNAMIIAGIGTLIQLYPIWKIGSRLPFVMGASFTFLSLAIAIASTQGMGVLVGAVIVGGVIQGLLGLLAKYWIKIITPIVAAVTVTGVGLSLLPIGASFFAGGLGTEDFGSVNNWIVGSITLLTCLGFQVFAKGYLKSLAMLLGLIIGYVVAFALGMVTISFEDAKLIALPTILPFKPEFQVGAILSVVCLYLVSAAENIGNTIAVTNTMLNRDTSLNELRGAIAGAGFASSLAGVFGLTPLTSYSQNVGLMKMNRVVNRFSIATGAAVMLLAGLFPFLGIILTSIPQAVLGGCTLMVFGFILFAGFEMIAKCGFTERNMIIVSFSLSVGFGFTLYPEMFDIFPKMIRLMFAQNCVALVFLLALILNLILPKEKNI